MATVANERPIPTGEGLTFEKVWAMFQEDREQMREYREQMREMSLESDRKMKKTRRMMRELSLKADRRNEEADRRHKETEQQMKETDRQMKETDRKIGELGNRFGELAEHLVAPGIANRFNERGHHFDGVAPGGYEIRNEQGKVIAEVDILLENGDCIVAVEVKTRPRMQDIEHHAKRLEILRAHRNKKNDARKIYGAIAGAVYGEEEKTETIKAGFYVLEQSGDTMKMDIPEDFIPREY